jgi:hypothetical protein
MRKHGFLPASWARDVVGRSLLSGIRPSGLGERECFLKSAPRFVPCSGPPATPSIRGFHRKSCAQSVDSWRWSSPPSTERGGWGGIRYGAKTEETRMELQVLPSLGSEGGKPVS